MDFGDQAQKINEAHLARAIAGARMAEPSAPSAAECRECGEPIPQRRREAMPGVQLCLDCQRESEGGFWP